MFPQRIGLISVMLVVVISAAPRRTSRPTVPTWHLPCGRNIPEVVSSENYEDDLRDSFDSIKLQHQLTMNDYLIQDYEYFYEKVRISIHDYQYIPSWVPGKREANLVKRLADADPQTIINHFPKLHLDLQKFAVAFEELVEDESSSQIQRSLRATQSHLTMMLCEIETNIMVFPNLQIPTRVERSIMTSVERDPVDETRRLIRDWGVILKYRDYLHAWRHVFKY